MKKLLIFERTLALVYDLVLLIMLILFVFFSIEILNAEFFQFTRVNSTIVTIIAGLLLYVVFFALLPIKLNGTIGKAFAELEVSSTIGKFTFGRWFFREIIFKHLLYMTGVGVIVEIFFIVTKKQTIHDYYLKTEVIKK